MTTRAHGIGYWVAIAGHCVGASSFESFVYSDKWVGWQGDGEDGLALFEDPRFESILSLVGETSKIIGHGIGFIMSFLLILLVHLALARTTTTWGDPIVISEVLEITKVGPRMLSPLVSLIHLVEETTCEDFDIS